MKFSTLSILSAVSAVSAFSASANDNVVLYWGQNSAGTQESLGSYCQSTDADMYVISFLTDFPETGLNIVGCDETFSGTNILHCSSIAEDIKSCQDSGKKVLLSLGGAVGTYGFTDDNQAEEYAETLWNMFGGGQSETRPFDDVIVDGFDLDIENNNNIGYAALTKKLREYYNGGDYYISGAPQCVYPDASLGDALENGYFDFVFVQFYNNPCGVDRDGFNWDTWKDFAASSPNPNVKIFLGIPASTTSASSGYSTPAKIQDIVSTVQGDSCFGGIMMWDASQAFSNVIDGQTYCSSMKNVLSSSSSSSTSSTNESSSSSDSDVSSSSQVSSNSGATSIAQQYQNSQSSSTLVSSSVVQQQYQATQSSSNSGATSIEQVESSQTSYAQSFATSSEASSSEVYETSQFTAPPSTTFSVVYGAISSSSLEPPVSSTQINYETATSNAADEAADFTSQQLASSVIVVASTVSPTQTDPYVQPTNDVVYFTTTVVATAPVHTVYVNANGQQVKNVDVAAEVSGSSGLVDYAGNAVFATLSASVSASSVSSAQAESTDSTTTLTDVVTATSFLGVFTSTVSSVSSDHTTSTLTSTILVTMTQSLVSTSSVEPSATSSSVESSSASVVSSSAVSASATATAGSGAGSVISAKNIKGQCEGKTGNQLSTCLNKQFQTNKSVELKSDASTAEDDSSATSSAKSSEFDVNSCTDGAVSCYEGKFALCNFGHWVYFACPATTMCSATTLDDASIVVGCNFESIVKAEEAKASLQANSSTSVKRRHVHHAHQVLF